MGFSLSSVTDSIGGGLGQALGAVFGLGSDLIGTGINAYANHREADLNRDWQERMAKNAYQYRVADLRAAGLNPILGTGQNVSTPSGATAQGNPASMANSGRFMSELMSNAMKKSNEVADSQIAVNAAQANRLNAEADVLKIDADYREFEKWTNGLSGVTTGVASGVGTSLLLNRLFGGPFSNSRQISGFAQAAEKTPVSKKMVEAVKAGGSRAGTVLKAVTKVAGPAVALGLLTEAAFDREKVNAERDKEREKQGKEYKSTFNFDRHF